MLAVMCAKWVGDALSRSIYEELMELKSITFLGHHAPHWSHYMTCVEVCNNQDDVKCVNEVESVERLIQLLQTTTHNAFPVVCSSLDNPKLTKTYRGLILRKNLVMLLSMKMFKRDATEGEGPQVIRYEEYVMLTNRKWPLQNAKLPPRDDRQNWVLDVSAYVDRSSPVVMQSFAFSDAYRLFQVCQSFWQNIANLLLTVCCRHLDCVTWVCWTMNHKWLASWHDMISLAKSTHSTVTDRCVWHKTCVVKMYCTEQSLYITSTPLLNVHSSLWCFSFV